MPEKYAVKIGIGVLDKKMSVKQALKYAEKNMPRDLKKARFKAIVSEVPFWIAYPDLNSDKTAYLRISYGKVV